MAHLQELANVLLSAGAAQDSAGDGVLFFYTNNGTLVSKRWTGSAFRDEEEIAKSIRNQSPVTYIQTDDARRIICISDDSKTIAFKYDEDEDEWCLEGGFPKHEVHPESGLAATTDDDGKIFLIYQSPSGSLMSVTGTATPAPLAVNAVLGSPISINDQADLGIFYISREDNYVHATTLTEDGSWVDGAMVKYPLPQKLKRMCLFPNKDKENALQPYVLTGDNEVILVDGDARVDGGNTLGKIDGTGTFKASSTTEAGRPFSLRDIHSRGPVYITIVTGSRHQVMGPSVGSRSHRHQRRRNW